MKTEWVVELSFNRAKRLAGNGDLEGAYDIISELPGRDSRETFMAMRRSWREALLVTLRARFPSMEIYPLPAQNIRDLKRFNLKSREVFVLGLYDGVTSLDDAVAVSPVDELDTLRATDRLISLGLLRITDRVT